MKEKETKNKTKNKTTKNRVTPNHNKLFFIFILWCAPAYGVRLPTV